MLKLHFLKAEVEDVFQYDFGIIPSYQFIIEITFIEEIETEFEHGCRSDKRVTNVRLNPILDGSRITTPSFNLESVVREAWEDYARARRIADRVDKALDGLVPKTIEKIYND